MEAKSIGRDDLRALKVGEWGVWTLPDAKAVESARVTVSTMKRLEGMEFERIPVKDPLVLAYKRTK